MAGCQRFQDVACRTRMKAARSIMMRLMTMDSQLSWHGYNVLVLSSVLSRLRIVAKDGRLSLSSIQHSVMRRRMCGGHDGLIVNRSPASKASSRLPITGPRRPTPSCCSRSGFSCEAISAGRRWTRQAKGYQAHVIRQVSTRLGHRFCNGCHGARCSYWLNHGDDCCHRKMRATASNDEEGGNCGWRSARARC